MKILQKDQLDLVRPKFREMVQKAWNNNEDVPYGVVLLSDEPPTEEDIARVKELIKNHKIEDKI